MIGKNRQQQSGLSSKTPFFDTKLLIACWGFPLSILLIVIITLLFHRLSCSWSMLLFPVVAAAFSRYAWQESKRPFQMLDELILVLQKCRLGELHHRITDTRRLGELGKLAWELNDLLDMIESTQ